MGTRTIRILLVALAAVAAAGGCTTTRLETESSLPPPLIDRVPARVGIYYSKEFREYVHKEKRNQFSYEVTLGPAHVINLDWLLKAMFSEVIPVDDPTRVGSMKPPLNLVLEPKFDEYSFLTPDDVAGEAFIVTIRYLLTVYDGAGSRVDSYTFTGYGREKGKKLANKEPLQVATQRAMRDAGAKVAVELTDQDAVRILLHGPAPELPTLPAEPQVDQQPAAPPAPEPQPGSGSGG